MSLYVVDSNFFIQAYRAYYPLDVVPSFWTKIKKLAHTGTICSIDKVKIEIYKNDDDLKRWCIAELPNGFFHDSTAVITQYGRVAQWANSRRSHYSAAALTEFLAADEADAWLVAFGIAQPNTRTLVTYETSEPNRKNKIKIPEACNHFGLPFMDTVSMLRVLNEPI